MAVKVKRERPDQRRHHRVTAPLYLLVDGERIRVADWSLGGLRIENFPGPVPDVGTELQLQLCLPFQGFDVSFDAKAEVVRNDPAQAMFAVKFTELGERERELMHHFIEELIRGSMTDIEDTIQRIDVPVTPASLKPDVNPIKALPMRRWPVKAVAMTGLYMFIGVLVFGYAVLLAYTNFFRMEVQTAVIAAPLETVQVQADGRVAWTERKPGEKVRAGEVVLRVIDNQLERDIEIASLAVQERKAQLLYLKRRQSDELERVQDFAKVDMKLMEQGRIELDALQVQLKAAEQYLGRIEYLHTRGFATDTQRDEARKGVVTLKQKLDQGRVELSSRAELAASNFGKRHYNGRDIVGNIDDIEAKLQLAAYESKLAEERHNLLVKHRQRLAVRAPFDGTLLDLPRVDQGTVKRGDVVAVIEQREARHVTAYLTQDEVVKIGLGDDVDIFVPALGEKLKGRVEAIDRTSGFIQEQGQARAPGYRWRGSSDRSAKVRITFDKPSLVADNERFRAGLPVVVIFEQQATNPLIDSVWKKLSWLL